VLEATMNRHLAHGLGAIALGALLLQPVTTLADPPDHARNERTAQHRGYSGHDSRDDDRWDDRRDDCHDDDRHYRNYGPGDDDRRGWEWRGYRPRPGYVAHHLPPKHRAVRHHGHRYYYGDGAWYRSHGSRYVVVDPPPGLVVSFLPWYSSTLYVGGAPYYRAGPVYYVWHPRARGYLVTDNPYRRW
jgi:hypothetical protein